MLKVEYQIARLFFVTCLPAMTSPPPGSRGIDQILSEARSHLVRITPSAALAEYQSQTPASPVLLVDIRPAAQRLAEGSFSGSNVLIIERNVLEWRFDPRCDSKLDVVGKIGYGLRVIVFCQEGYTSSLAARALQELGLEGATDMDGGFRAWREGGLPREI